MTLPCAAKGAPLCPLQQQLDMKIELWYTKEVSQWRWTLTDPDHKSYLESGSSSDLKKVLEDVGRAVEWKMSGAPLEE